jgi:hypothetical protein
MRRLIRISVVASLALAACKSERICVGPVGPSPTDLWAVTAEIRDAVTALPAAYHAWLIIRDGSFADSLRNNYSDSTTALTISVGQRPGTYAVTVRREGYLPWTTNGVVARTVGDCDYMKGALLQVQLQRAAQPSTR